MTHKILGSGSLEQDGPLCIVAMEKREQTRLVHHHPLGKRQRHADKTSQTLPQRVLPPLHRGGFSCLFAHCCVLFRRDHSLSGGPEIREAVSSTIVVCNALPQPLARLFTPITHRRGDHLSPLAAQGNPHPGVVRFFEHKRPPFVPFQRYGSGILWMRGKQGGTSGRKLSSFF
jgi:hypothetical protein